MIKWTLLISCFLSFSLTEQRSYAKLSYQHAAKLYRVCLKRHRKLKNSADFCTCQKKNFRWSFRDAQWDDVEKIYLGKMTRKEMRKRDGLSAVDFLIVSVESACLKDSNYVAPKVKKIMNKRKTSP